MLCNVVSGLRQVDREEFVRYVVGFELLDPATFDFVDQAYKASLLKQVRPLLSPRLITHHSSPQGKPPQAGPPSSEAGNTECKTVLRSEPGNTIVFPDRSCHPRRSAGTLHAPAGAVCEWPLCASTVIIRASGAAARAGGRPLRRPLRRAPGSRGGRGRRGGRGETDTMASLAPPCSLADKTCQFS